MLRIEPLWQVVNQPLVEQKKDGLAGLEPMGEFLMICVFCAFLWRFLLLVSGDAFGERVAMDTEDGGGVGDVLLVPRQGFLDVELFEFAQGFIQKDVALEHFVDQAFETVVNQSSFPVNNLYASR